MVSKSLGKYLKNYAEKEISCLANFPKDRFYAHSVLIPCYLEDNQFLERLDTNLPRAKGKVLVVVISNHPLGLRGEKLRLASSSHEKLCRFLGESVWLNQPLSLFQRTAYDVLLVNHTADLAIPEDQGVGLARKAGGDLILSLIASGSVLSPWVMSTDADTLLPDDYFSLQPEAGSSALTYPFEHICDQSRLGQATKLYEQSIKHYVRGLAYADSDYAFSTLGSCLAFHCESYAQARGFPKRSGGEDFYLLNKLAKLGKVESGNDLPLLKIEARQSSRVPFGTGPAVIRLLQSPDMYNEAIFYNPDIFVQLKHVLGEIAQRPMSLKKFKLDEITLNALLGLGLEKAINHANKQKLSEKQYDLHMKSWLDGFKTLKFVHQLRDTMDNNGRARWPNLTARQIKHGDKETLS